MYLLILGVIIMTIFQDTILFRVLFRYYSSRLYQLFIAHDTCISKLGLHFNYKIKESQPIPKNGLRHWLRPAYRNQTANFICMTLRNIFLCLALETKILNAQLLQELSHSTLPIIMTLLYL